MIIQPIGISVGIRNIITGETDWYPAIIIQGILAQPGPGLPPQPGLVIWYLDNGDIRMAPRETKVRLDAINPRLQS
jgi:hypothetical protein